MKNEAKQPLGPPVVDWSSPPRPRGRTLKGHWSTLEVLNPSRVALYLGQEFSRDSDEDWTYLPYGPFESLDQWTHWLEQHGASKSLLSYVIFQDDRRSKPVGLASYMRIREAVGSLEIGHVHFSRALQRTPAATEAVYSMLCHAFELGYRRVEWKCDALNERSVRAAKRFGFQPEGIFRNDVVYKGRSRDTAWFSIIVQEWPSLQNGYRAWLSPSNFDDAGVQKASLSNRLAESCGPKPDELSTEDS